MYILFHFHLPKIELRKRICQNINKYFVSKISLLQCHHRDDRKVWCQRHVRGSAQNRGAVLFTANINHGEMSYLSIGDKINDIINR